MNVVDTHCHIHEAQYEMEGDDSVRAKWLRAKKGDPDKIIADAVAAGVTRMICVGTDVDDSVLAVDFVQKRAKVWASIGIHPHEAKRYIGDADSLVRFAQLAGRPKVVAIGECGLDYFYEHSSKADQIKILRFQLELAIQHDLPLIFHIRDAFEDFWPVFDEYQVPVNKAGKSKSESGDAGRKSARKSLRGVVHSFTATRRELDQALARGLYIGLNGIMTFTKDQAQLEAAKAVPADRLLIETDAPFLTPVPERGTICEPKHAITNLSFIARLQKKTDQQLAGLTTANACRLFNL